MKQEMNDMARNNKTGIKTHTITVAVMLVFCLLRLNSGLDSIGYVLLAAILGFSPIIAEWVYWKKQPETTMIKHCISYGFAIFYTFIIFTADNHMVFLFVIPMILVVSIYNDMRYCILINMGVLIENILLVILGAQNGAFGFIGRDYAVIQIVIVVLVGIYSGMASKTLMKNEKYRLAKLMEAKQESEANLERLELISGHMKTNIQGGYQEIEKLNTASTLTKQAMDEVSTGITEVADAVQNQILQTEEIKKKVDLVSSATNIITGHMTQTLQVLENGNRDVEELVRQVEVSVNNGASVADKLQTLDKYMKEMNSIVELIADITSQTELLALNASIEAARAGEAGKGFAVVAAEINNMAAQTQNATGNIASLIHNVSTSINEVVTVIWDMISGINEQKSSTKRTADSFVSIQKNTYAIRDNAEILEKDVKQLEDANRRIMENIQTISAISEEVSAHANETIQAEEENLIVLKELSNNMEETIRVISQ